MAGMITDPRTGLMRIAPTLPERAFTTYQIAAPLRPATCEECDCEAWEQGWATLIDESTQLGRDQAAYIRSRSGRRFQERRTDAGLTEFGFYPGQACFTIHKLPAGAERFFRRAGDWRTDPRHDRHEFTRPDDWVDSFATHQDRLLTAMNGG